MRDNEYCQQIRGYLTFLEDGSRQADAATNQGGSSMKGAEVIGVSGGRYWRQGRTREQILKADAAGPRLPTIIGNADEANHQRL